MLAPFFLFRYQLAVGLQANDSASLNRCFSPTKRCLPSRGLESTYCVLRHVLIMLW